MYQIVDNPVYGMQNKSIAIIGGGVAGLATGCYARMNGYLTHIFEMSSIPGGVCTSWRRGDYVFDGCINWLMGSRSGTSINGVWQELGALVGRQIVDHDEFMRIEGRTGETLILYTDANRLEEHLRALAPADAKMSHALCEAIRRSAQMDLPTPSSATHLPDWLATVSRALPLAPTALQWGRLTWQELSARFTDHFVRDAVRSVFDSPDFPALGGIMMLGAMHARDAGYPIGGSLAFAQAIEQRYLGLGGEITYGARIQRILVENGQAVGVRLADGTEQRADIVISAADGHTTIFDMLEGKYANEEIRQYYQHMPVFSAIVQVSLGVARDMSDEPHTVTFPLTVPTEIAGMIRESLTVRHLAYDPTLAPSGKATLTVTLQTDYDHWEALSHDRAAYQAEKSKIIDQVIAVVEQRLPGLTQQVEVKDIATPMTWVWSTGNWRGAFEGWLPTRKAIAMGFGGGMPKTLPGLTNFFMVGQWVVPGGGLPGVAPSGRALVQRLCKQDGKQFITTRAESAPAHLLPTWPTVSVAEPVTV